MRQLLPFIILFLLALITFFLLPVIAGEIEYHKWKRKERTNGRSTGSRKMELRK